MKINHPAAATKPHWLKKKIFTGPGMHTVTDMLARNRLHTVCEEARCPNIGECFSRGTATFLILGDTCTRSCRFCAVKSGMPEPPDSREPERVATAVHSLGLRYVVVTSVTRDDLPEGGAGQFASTVKAVRALSADIGIEVLVPDFLGGHEALMTVLRAGPDVFNHNVETVPRLYPTVRCSADYRRSIDLIREAGRLQPEMTTKSGIMLGLGEREEEVVAVLEDLREAGCGLLTIGQYLRPSAGHYPVVRYVPPVEFDRWRDTALKMGFRAVASGPFVRSSYRAEEMASVVNNA